MKVRIAAFGGDAQHLCVDQLAVESPQSLSDYDGILFDPALFAAQIPQMTSHERLGEFNQTVTRRQREFNVFLNQKPGVVICYLRPLIQSPLSNYAPLQSLLLNNGSPLPLSTIVSGLGFKYKVVQRDEPASKYFSILKGALKIEAHFGTMIESGPEHVLAVDPLNQVIAAAYQVPDGGKIYFLPVPNVASSDNARIGAAVVELVRTYYGGGFEDAEPEWCKSVLVPTSDRQDAEIARLEANLQGVRKEIGHLHQLRDSVRSHKRLLYSTGTQMLEPAVRNAFRLIGFDVPEPDEYEEEWDAKIVDVELGYGIGEIEGPEGAIDRDKYRQLRDYIDDEIAAGRDPKGFLIGNGYRNSPLDSEERKRQFTEAAFNSGVKQGFCLLPTSELFKAVCALLDNPAQELKRHIRRSLFKTVGVWEFVPMPDTPSGST